mgnify:FL=1
MDETWRLFRNTTRLLSTAEGLAVDDTLPQSVALHGSPPILHLYSFVPSAIVGKYQDIEAALRLDRCEARGIEVNRRSTGGGTVIMGPEVISLGLGIELDHPGLEGGGVGALFATLSRVLADALAVFDVPAYFQPRNDLEVAGQKIAGLSAASEVGKSLLFHTSLLVDFDVELMLDIMNTPLLKLSDKGYNCFSQRMTTVQRAAGCDVEVGAVMDAIAAAFESVFGIRFQEDEPDAWERNTIQEFIDTRYTQRDWIFSHKHPRARMGVGRVKTSGGMLEVYLSLSGASIENVVITGDFFSTSEAVNRLEKALKWTSAREERIAENLARVWEKDMIYGVDVPTLTQVLVQAKENQVRL